MSLRQAWKKRSKGGSRGEKERNAGKSAKRKGVGKGEGGAEREKVARGKDAERMKEVHYIFLLNRLLELDQKK